MISKPKYSKNLLVIIAVLMAANIIGILYFISNRPTRNNGGNYDRKVTMVNYLKNDLNFSATQLQSYDSLEEVYRQLMKPLYDTLRNEKEKRIRYLSELAFTDSAITSTVNNAALKQQMMETKMLLHLKNIRNLCSDEQKKKYDTSIYKIFVRKTPDKK